VPRRGERTRRAVLDEYLVVRSQLGDSEAFGRLVRRWHRRLLGHAFRFTGEREAAEDVTQESWMAIMKGLRSLHDPARFRPWALRIVANKARDRIRRESTRRRTSRRAPAEPAPAEATAASDAVRRVQAGLAGLDPDQRAVLSCFYLEEMSVREIADALSVPVGTVKSRLFYAREALRQRLEDTS